MITTILSIVEKKGAAVRVRRPPSASGVRRPRPASAVRARILSTPLVFIYARFFRQNPRSDWLC